MIMKPSASLCNNSRDAFEKREQMLKLRERILQAEQERIDGVATFTVSQARKQLRERVNDIQG